MSEELVIVEKEKLTAIANAVRTSTSSSETFNVSELSAATVEVISAGGGSGGGGASEGVSNETTYTEGVAYTFDWIEKTAISSGAETSNNGKKATPYLYCAGVAGLLIDVTVSWSSGNYSAWYDKDKNYISSFQGTRTAGVSLFKTPVNAAYFRISTNNDVEVVIKPYVLFNTGWRRIRTVTIPEDIATDTSGVSFVNTTDGGVLFAFDTDELGKPFALSDVMCHYEQHTVTQDTSIRYNSCRLLNEAVPAYNQNCIQFPIASSKGSAVRGITCYENTAGAQKIYASYFGGTFMNQCYANTYHNRDLPCLVFSGICLNPNLNMNVGFAPGSTFTFYGRDLK